MNVDMDNTIQSVKALEMKVYLDLLSITNFNFNAAYVGWIQTRDIDPYAAEQHWSIMEMVARAEGYPC